jgi:hypothetical protein
MSRARKTDKRAKPAPRARPLRGSSDVEREVLALAQRIAAIAAEPEPPATSWRAALELIVTAHAADGRLAPALIETWQRVRTDKRATLALGWAREQLRLAVADVLAREAKARRLRGDVPLDALAWVVVAASESAVHEAPASLGDRVDALLAVTAPSAPAC